MGFASKNGDKILTEQDGLKYKISSNLKDLKKGSMDTINMYITYSGVQIPNFKFDVEIAADNIDAKSYDFKNGSFYTYLQAFQYINNGETGNFKLIDADTNITTNANEPVKIIFANIFTTNLPNILLKSEDDSGSITLPETPLIHNNVEYKPCQKANKDAATFSLSKGGLCYLEINATSSDTWSFLPINRYDEPETPAGFKSADNINITIN